MQIVEFVQGFIEKTQKSISDYEKITEYAHKGVIKKERVDEEVTSWFDSHFDKLVKINFIFKGAVKKALRKKIPDFTQMIYNLIKTSIKGITKA